MDFTFKPEIIERDNLFLPAGFDSLTLINELSKAAKIFDLDPSGNTILFEDVIKMPQRDNAPGRARSYLQPKMEECADWNTLLHERLSGKSPSKAKPTLNMAASLIVPDSKPLPRQSLTKSTTPKAGANSFRKPSILNNGGGSTPRSGATGSEGERPSTPSGSAAGSS